MSTAPELKPLQKLAKEYRPSMDSDVLHSWAADVVSALSASPSDTGGVKAKPLDLSAILRDAFLSGRGLKVGDKLSDEDQTAWVSYDPEKMQAYKRVSAVLDASRRSALASPVPQNESDQAGTYQTVEEYNAIVKARSPRDAVTEAMVEDACAVYAEKTGYYVSFHRGLRSTSSDNMRQAMRAALTAALQQGAAHGGMVLVPKEPTPEMHLAGELVEPGIGGSPPSVGRIYRAMIAAAPEQEKARCKRCNGKGTVRAAEVECSACKGAGLALTDGAPS